MAIEESSCHSSQTRPKMRWIYRLLKRASVGQQALLLLEITSPAQEQRITRPYFAAAQQLALSPCRVGYSRDLRTCDGVCADCDCLPGFKCCCRTPQGYYSLGDRALKCPGGTYQDEFAAGFCKPCPGGSGETYIVASTVTRKTDFLTSCIHIHIRSLQVPLLGLRSIILTVTCSYKRVASLARSTHYNDTPQRVPSTSTIVPSTAAKCKLSQCTAAQAGATNNLCQAPDDIVASFSAPTVLVEWCQTHLALPSMDRSGLRNLCVFRHDSSDASRRISLSSGVVIVTAMLLLRFGFG